MCNGNYTQEIAHTSGQGKFKDLIKGLMRLYFIFPSMTIRTVRKEKRKRNENTQTNNNTKRWRQNKNEVPSREMIEWVTEDKIYLPTK